MEFERVLSEAREDLRELLQSEDLRPQREAVLASGSVLAVREMQRVAEKRLALVQERLGDSIRKAEMMMGEMVSKVNQFNQVTAPMLWPRLEVHAKPYASAESNRYEVRVRAKVKNETEYCINHTEPWDVFPSEELQAMLGLVG